MTTASEALLAEENKQSGRVVPAWRFWTGYVTVWFAPMGSFTVGIFEWPMWLVVAAVLIPLVIYSALFNKFKARTIR